MFNFSFNKIWIFILIVKRFPPAKLDSVGSHPTNYSNSVNPSISGGPNSQSSRPTTYYVSKTLPPIYSGKHFKISYLQGIPKKGIIDSVGQCLWKSQYIVESIQHISRWILITKLTSLFKISNTFKSEWLFWPKNHRPVI